MARYSVADLNDHVTRGRAQAATGGVYGGRQEVIGHRAVLVPEHLLRFMLNWDIVNVDRLNAAGTTQIGQRFHTIALRSAAGVLKAEVAASPGRHPEPGVRSGWPAARSSIASPPTSSTPAPQAAQKASIGGTRPGASASLSSSATSAVITHQGAPISAQAMRCMGPCLRHPVLRARRPSGPLPMNTQGWARTGR